MNREIESRDMERENGRPPSQAESLRRAVFLDRDGTLNVERNYLKDPARLVLLPGVAEALRSLRDEGFLLFVVTNQSGIGRGYYTVDDMHAVNRRLEAILAAEGIRFERIYFAPEAPDQPSRGRKPSPQFLFDARDEYRLDLGRSYLVGDKLADVECGWNAGIRASLLVRTGYGRETEARHPDLGKRAVVVEGLEQAAVAICSDARALAGLPREPGGIS